MHPSSVAVSREHRRAKTDRLDTELLMRAFLGWLWGERRHCSMAAIPTIEEEDAKRPNRHEKLVGDHAHRELNEVDAGAPWDPMVQADFTQGRRKARQTAHCRRNASAENTREELGRAWHGFVSCASS